MGMEYNVPVEQDLYDRLVTRAEDNGFESPEAYGRTVLETVVAELEGDRTDDAVADRLADLGYLD